MINLYNNILALFFYYLGDGIWNIIRCIECSEITRKLFLGSLWASYQKCMSLSLDYDEKCGYKIWKLPENN